MRGEPTRRRERRSDSADPDPVGPPTAGGSGPPAREAAGPPATRGPGLSPAEPPDGSTFGEPRAPVEGPSPSAAAPTPADWARLSRLLLAEARPDAMCDRVCKLKRYGIAGPE